jgi:hypothetical protein
METNVAQRQLFDTDQNEQENAGVFALQFQSGDSHDNGLRSDRHRTPIWRTLPALNGIYSGRAPGAD